MKIGTITFWDTEDNYGQVLQCYALIKYLEDRGHQPQLVKTDQSNLYDQSYIHKIYTLFGMVLHPRRFLNLRKRNKAHNVNKLETPAVDRHFSEFKKNYIPSTEKVYTYSELCYANLGMDAFVCGSDQVWSGFSKLMFLQFPGSFKRISYAASFGGARPQNGLDKKKEGVEICNSLKAKAHMVPDPTLLLGEKEYEKLIQIPKETRDEDYVLLYLLGNEMSVTVDEIMAFAKANHLNVKYVASQNRNDGFDKIYPSIGEWLYLIKHASYIITNSFHGTVFSLQFHTPFVTIPLAGETARMNGRIFDLLTDCGLKERIYTDSLNQLLRPLDFTLFEQFKNKGIERVNELMNKTGL